MEKKRLLIVEDDYVEANDLRLIVEKAGYSVIGVARSVNQALDLAEQTRPNLALLDISLQGKLTGIDLARILVAKNIPFIYLSANCSAQTLESARSTRPYGFLVKPFRSQDVLAALSIADYRLEKQAEDIARQQNQLQSELHNLGKRAMPEKENILQLGKLLQSYFPFDYLGYERFDGEGRCSAATGYYRVGFDEYKSVELRVSSSPQISSDLVKAFYTEMDTELTSRLLGAEHQNTLSRLRMHSVMVIPLHWRDERIQLTLASRQLSPYSARHIELIERVLPVLREEMENIFDPNRNNTRSTKDPIPQIPDRSAFSGIVGSSSSLLHVFDEIRQVAPLATSVLILGESGTGKEKIAESIHRLSDRKEGPFIRINCAGFPASLIESELFGHEKGAFTGAIERRIGKFELADKGTIFLDEIGEMPLESQVKILRVLQEHQIERIGGRSVTRLDIRVIAATNRNLEEEVASGRFRLDLYYRLNVFPIFLPPLRDRLEDIPALTRHFIDAFRRRTGKNILDVKANALSKLQNYHWPGNIRELEHVLERSLVMCKGDVLNDIILPGVANRTPTGPQTARNPSELKSMVDFEREYLVSVLKQCNGRMSGKNGAASILGIPASTLHSKLIKLGIKTRGE